MTLAMFGKYGWGVALLGGFVVADTAPMPSAVSNPPNILLILADDLGYGDICCYNSESKVATPFIDQLAAEGMRFSDAHSPSTVCTPTRYSILTGRMAFRTGYRGVVVGVGGPCLIEQDRLTLPQMLRDQGYATALIGKWHVGLTFLDQAGNRITRGGIEGVKLVDYSRPIPDAPIHRGFDRFFGTACCPTTDHLYAYIDGDRIPVPPTGLLDKSRLPKHAYSGDNRDGLVAPDFDLEEVDLVFLRKSREFLESHVQDSPDQPFFLMHSAQAVHQPSFPARVFQGRTQAGPHGDFIAEFDHVVGELMRTLERLGVAGNTLVIVTSDNGPETTAVVNMRADHDHDGARPWRGMKRDQWEGGHRVPFIARWPGHIQAGSVSDQTICLTDIMATCAAVSDASLPNAAAEDSFDLLPVLLGRQADPPVREFTLHQTISLALAIRSGDWKYLDHRGSGGNNYGRGRLTPFALEETAPEAPGQLYNLRSDPGETQNLYFKHPEVVRRLKGRLDASKEAGRSAPSRSESVATPME
jgi:arylsulfatase A-like enzyme